MTTTDKRTAVGGSRSELGYWRLLPGPGEPHVLRADLTDGAGRDSPGEPLLTIGHLSDLHVCDSQSPARAEFLDRWADDDSPVKHLVAAVGTYRAQDCLTVQVAEAAVQAMNAVPAGPVGGAPLDWTIVTGDVTDNAQDNEVGWYLRLLEGGPVVGDSGDPERYEGVASAEHPDEAYWHPELPPGVEDRPRRLHGFPEVPGLLDALRMPFDATGLAMPWLAVHGNHDQMIQGTIPAELVADFSLAGLSDRKAYAVVAGWTDEQIAQFCHDVDSCSVEALRRWPELPSRPITPDMARRTLTRQEFIAAHFGSSARPIGHGFPRAAATTGRAYYRYDCPRVTVLVLDTVNENGGWQGSLDDAQLAWLEGELADADRERRFVVLASHHPLVTLINPRLAPGGSARRILADELAATLAQHRCVVLWLNGHTHRNTVSAHPGAGGGWWEITAPAMIDFPQQGRIIELLQGADGSLTIAATMLDHAGELPWSGSVQSPLAIAGLSRELAANDWQWRVDDSADLAAHGRVGTTLDRNVLLPLPNPFA